MNERSTDSLEAAVQAAARQFPYPPTPNLAARGGPARRRPARRKLLPAAVLLALVLAVCLAIPPVRAQVRQFLQVGLVRIFLRETPPPGTPTGAPTPTPRVSSPSPGSLAPFELMGETSLEEAQAQVDFQIRLPSYPDDLGPPERVYLQEMGAPMLILVWTQPGQPDQVRLSLHLIAPGSFAVEKWDPATVEETQVKGQPAVWVTGPYPLRLTSDDLVFTRLIAGHVLVWEADGLTYRLETDLPLEQAVKIAESLQ